MADVQDETPYRLNHYFFDVLDEFRIKERVSEPEMSGILGIDFSRLIFQNAEVPMYRITAALERVRLSPGLLILHVNKRMREY